MQIIATSDLHGSFPEIPPCDVLLIAGDVCSRWDHSLHFQLQWLDTNFRNWLEETRRRVQTIIGIAGNHDFVFEKWPKEVERLALPWYYLQDDGVDLYIDRQIIKIYGTPWVPNLSLWAFHDDDHGLDARYSAVPEDTDIVLSHGPPHMFCDFTCPRFGSQHAGAPGLNEMLMRVQPKALVCGHIHEGYGISQHPSGAKIYNVSHMTENYSAENGPLVIDFERTETLSKPSRTHPCSSGVLPSDLSSWNICG